MHEVLAPTREPGWVLSHEGYDILSESAADPRLPPEWRNLSFRVCWRGRSAGICIAGGTVQATLVRGDAMEMRIATAKRTLTPGETLHVSI